MRVIELLVRADQVASVRAVFEDEGVDHVLVTESSDDESVLVKFPVPPTAVDHVLERLQSAGIETERFTVVTSVETARTPDIDALEERFEAGTAGEERVTNEEIRNRASEMHPDPVTYYSMTTLSAVVATAGLLLDSPAIVVGSMVIAPQVGSALVGSVGATLNEARLLRTGLRSQAVGLTLAIVGAAAFGATLRTTTVVPPLLDVTTVQQVSQRASPGLLSMVVAICAGSAGAFGLATALPVSLVGVMIAAALIPAAAAVGIGIAWGIPTLAVSAALLLVVNAASINLAGVATLSLLGYRPSERGLTESDARQDLRRALPAVAAIGLLVVVFLVATVPIAQQVGFERDANRVVEDVVTSDGRTDLQIVSVEATFGGVPPVASTRRVTVVLNRPADRAYPGLPEEIGRRLADRTGTPVSVEIVYRERTQYQPGPGSGATSRKKR